MPRFANAHATVLVDRYVLGDVLGRGGMAVVYRGVDQLLGREVAIKVLSDAKAVGHENARFVTEAKTLAALNHPGLVTVLDIYTEEDSAFLVMELVEGGSLAEKLQEGCLSSTETADIGEQIAAALAYVHSQGVVHRDLKPDNVLIGDDGRIRLADFGIARILADPTRHTATGVTVGTAAYVAPEQLSDRESSTPADIYSLGLVLLRCLTGSPAFTGTPAEACLARLSGPPDIPASLPAEWRSMLVQMTAMEPGGRPSANAVRDRLAALPVDLAHDEPTKADLPTLTHTKPLTAPIPQDGNLDGPTRDRESLISRFDGSALRQSIARRLSAWTEFSARGRMVAIASLCLIVVACIVIAANTDGSTPSPEPAPQVPGKIGQHLQSLHDAVSP